LEVISTVDLSGSSDLARSSLDLVTLQEYQHTLRLGDECEMLRKMKNVCVLILMNYGPCSFFSSQLLHMHLCQLGWHHRLCFLRAAWMRRKYIWRVTNLASYKINSRADDRMLVLCASFLKMHHEKRL